MFSSCKYRGDCFSPKYTPCSSSRSSSQCPRADISKDTFPYLRQFLLQQQHLAEQRGFHLPAAHSHCCQKLESWTQTAPVRLEQGFSAAAVQLEHLPQPKWGDDKGKGLSHCPQLRARKTDLEAIKQFRMMGKNVWHFTYSTCCTHCIQR